MSGSPTKDSSPTKVDKSVFTEKEEKVLKAAWNCLKAPPEIDIEKLKVAADFNTVKTASNTWGVIKKKLAALALPDAQDDDGTVAPPNTKSTPKKAGKKAAATQGEDEGQDVETLTKKRGKKAAAAKAQGEDQETESPTKKRGKKAAATDGEGQDQEVESPTKKRKAPKVVKAGGDETAVAFVLKTEEAGADDH